MSNRMRLKQSMLALLLCAVTTATGLCWESLHGPFVTETRFHVRFDDGERLLIGYLSGIHRSVDDGLTWTHLGHPIALPRAVLKTPADVLYCICDTAAWCKPSDGSTYALFRSPDRGRTWSRLRVDHNLTTVAFAGDTLFVTGGNSEVLVGAPSFFRSTDGGMAWESIIPIHSAMATGYAGFSPPYVQHGHLFVLFDHVEDRERMRFSSDRGTTWDTLVYRQVECSSPMKLLGLRRTFFNVRPLPEAYLDYSGDGGVTWTATLASDSGFRSLVSNGSGTLLVISEPGDTVKRSTDAGLTWTVAGRCPAGDRFSSLRFLGKTKLLAVGETGLYYRSSDFGSTWQYLVDNSGAMVRRTPSPSTDSLLVLTDVSGKWIESTDGGETWAMRDLPNDLASVTALCVLPSGNILTGCRTGLFQLGRDGRWSQYSFGGAIWSIAYGSGTGFYVATGSHGIWPFVYNGAVMRFDTSAMNEGGTRLTAGWLKYQFNNPDYRSLLVLPDSSIITGIDGRVERTTDGGAHWTRGDHLFSPNALARSTQGVVYAGTKGIGAFRSTDQGVTWVQTIDSLSSLSVDAMVCDSAGGVIAGTASGIFRTTHEDPIWHRMSEGLPDLPVNALTVAPNGCVYAGMGTSVYAFSGGEWVLFHEVPEQDTVLSLAATPDNTILAGTANSGLLRTEGLYVPLPPPRVQLLFPLAGAAVSSSTVPFVWRQSGTDVSRYWIEIATDSIFAFAMRDTTLCDTVYVMQGMANGRYWWRVRGKNEVGWGKFSAPRDISLLVTDVAGESEVPRAFSLSQNYPNPFNAATSIGYTVGVVSRQPRAVQRGQPLVVSNVKLAVYDLLGREVAVLVDEYKEPAQYQVEFDGAQLTSGVYICRMTAGSFVECRKMVLMK